MQLWFNHYIRLAGKIKKIVIIGPESTGKSTLTSALAGHYGTAYVPEYARAYLETLDRPYEEADLLEIAKGQAAAEEQQSVSASGGLLFCDTDLEVIKVWSEDKYGRCHPWILQQIAVREYDFYLLAYIDTAWQDDPLREHPEPDMRRYFYNIYLDIVQQSGIPFVIVKGDEEERIATAVEAIDAFLTL